MPTVLQLKERRAQTWERMKELDARAQGDAGLSAEDEAAYVTAEADLERQSKEIDRQERFAKLGEDLTEPDRRSVLVPGQRTGEHDDETRSGAELYADAFGGFLRHGVTGLEAEQRQALQTGVMASEDARELRAQGIATGAAGGFTVPEGFWARIVETMKAYGGMLEVANVIQTATGNKLPWVTNDDTGNVGALLAENTAVPEQDVTFGTKDLDAFIYTSKMTKLSLALLQDSAFDLESFIVRKHGERLGRIHNTHFTTGDGAGKPDGLVPGARTGRTGAAGQVTSITYDDLIHLEHSVNRAYRGANCRFMFADTSLSMLRRLKDADQRPLWQPSVQTGAASTLNGYSYVINDDVPAMAASAKSVLFGDFSQGYVIRIVKGLTILRLAERFADSLQVAFLGFDRADGTVDNADAFAAYVHPAA